MTDVNTREQPQGRQHGTTPHLPWLAAGAHSLTLCLSCQSCSTYWASRSRAVGWLFCPAQLSRYACCSLDVNLWLVTPPPNKFLYAGERRSRRKEREKKNGTQLRYELSDHYFKNSERFLFMHAYHWKRTTEAQTAAVGLRGGREPLERRNKTKYHCERTRQILKDFHCRVFFSCFASFKRKKNVLFVFFCVYRLLKLWLRLWHHHFGSLKGPIILIDHKMQITHVS